MKSVVKNKFDLQYFNSKILLFGEYLVIFNSQALTMPYSSFKGFLNFWNRDSGIPQDKFVKSNHELELFLKFYLSDPSLQKEVPLDAGSFRKDIEKGLYFESDIPQSYGLGSSGALIAALYNRYNQAPSLKNDPDSLKILKRKLSLLETYFHGTSSGMDPLTSYLNHPLLFAADGKVSDLKSSFIGLKDLTIFLIDSGYPGNTQELVNLFLQKNRQKDYRRQILDEQIPLNNLCISGIFSGNTEDFLSVLKEYSSFQFMNYSEMIPKGFDELWIKGLNSSDYYLKLCGSGGGGYLLGFTKKYEKVSEFMNTGKIKTVPVSHPFIKAR